MSLRATRCWGHGALPSALVCSTFCCGMWVSHSCILLSDCVLWGVRLQLIGGNSCCGHCSGLHQPKPPAFRIRVALQDRKKFEGTFLLIVKEHYLLAVLYSSPLITHERQCTRGDSLDAFFDEFQFDSTPKIALIGCGCSTATEPVAEISHKWNISQARQEQTVCNCYKFQLKKVPMHFPKFVYAEKIFINSTFISLYTQRKICHF